MRIDLKINKKHLRKSINFLRTNEHCPTCDQTITKNFRSAKKVEITTQLGEFDKATVELKGKLDSILEKIAEKSDLTKELSRCQHSN